MPRSPSARVFIENIDINSRECILWPFSLDRKGYGKVSIDGKTIVASRYSLIFHKGEPPEEGMFACHEPVLCHNRSCVNPNHLSWKTCQQNAKDRILDKTWGGEMCNSKLTDKEVLRILSDVRSYDEIASDYSVTVSNIRSIKEGVTWSHLKGVRNKIKNRNIRFTDQQIVDIKNDDRTLMKIASDYGCSYSTIYRYKKSY